MSDQDVGRRGSAENPVVIIPVQTFQPWPEGEVVDVAGVILGRAPGDDAYLMQAVVACDADDTDDTLHRRARATLEAVIE